jgi:hypothetical protein
MTVEDPPSGRQQSVAQAVARDELLRQMVCVCAADHNKLEIRRLKGALENWGP